MQQSYSVVASSVNYYVDHGADHTITIFNGVTKLKTSIKFKSGSRSGGGVRKAIKEFSSRSRLNMMQGIFSRSLYPSLFITLTYPRFYPACATEWKCHLDNFYKALRRKLPGSCFYWKLEPQKRGAPHFHLLGLPGEEINLFLLRQIVAAIWFRVCDTGDFKHFLAGTSVEPISGVSKKIRAYVCKYIGKSNFSCTLEAWQTPGRFWGILGRNNLPPCLANKVKISKEDFYRVKRCMRSWLKRLSPSSCKYSERLKKLPSFFLFVSCEVMIKLVEFITCAILPPPEVFLQEEGVK
ncbi:MAG TPA: hypothetical protein DEQ20_04885 [Desulfobulbaceae bacterium]|nr:hypothetical protein [Desulfobulbaceae bacterium]